MTPKQYIKKHLRKVFKVNKYQNIGLTLKQRYKIKIQKQLYKTKFCAEDVTDVLFSMGVKKGDNVMIHCSYAEFFNYCDSPSLLIESVIELIGESGTLFMPCYDTKKEYFDVNYSPSMAGVLSEVFRRKEGVIRSICTNFAIAGFGPLAKDVTKDHIFSQYGFDFNSPYYKFCQLDNCKVILFGLGKKSIYFSMLHCIDWMLKDSLLYYTNLMRAKHEGVVIDYDGVEHKKKYVARISPNKLHHGRIRLLYRRMQKNTWSFKRLSNLDIVVYDAREALKTGVALAYDGKPIYKTPKPKKSLFVPIG